MREPVRLTIRALRGGQLAAAAFFGVALVAQLLVQEQLSMTAATIGVLVVIATPAVSLLATIVEARRTDRPTVIAAALVLAVLGVATGVALIIGR
jgi:drug/metabolite transporter (DMT)-like permease